MFSVADGDPALDAVMARNAPMVVVDEPDLGGRTSFVGIDDHAEARLAAAHLIELPIELVVRTSTAAPGRG